MMRATCLVWIGIVIVGAWPAQANELLAARRYDPGAGIGWGPGGFDAVKFYLADGAALGASESPYWHEGDSGAFIFGSGVSNWATFTSHATNGVNEMMLTWVEFEPKDGAHASGYTGWSESLYFGQPTDLVGYNVDYVRLIVSNVHMWTEGSLFHVSADTTWQFWGTAVPEPATAALLALGSLLVRRLRC